MWDLLIPIVTTLAGAWITSSSNDRATQQAQQGQQAQIDELRQANEAAQQALDASKAETQALYSQTQDVTAPGVAYLRTTVANQNELTPAQQQRLEQLRRSVTSQLRGSSFAGSGRTAAALFRQAESDFTNNALDQNRARADAAASTLANQNFSARQGVAGSAASYGVNRANLATGNASQVGQVLANQGETAANATTATGNVMGQAVGDVGSVIAAQNRESRYADRMKEIEKSLGVGA